MAAKNGAKTPGFVDPQWIKDVADILQGTDLAEIEVENDGLKLRVARATAAAPMMTEVRATPLAAAPAMVQANPAAPPPETPASSSSVDPKDHPGAVTSPIVGTAYTSPEPGAAPFVTVGGEVKEGQTVMIVEAMKTMNPIPAHKSGKVQEILVDNEQPVQYGDALVIIA